MAKKIKTGSVFFRDQYSPLVDGGAPGTVHIRKTHAVHISSDQWQWLPVWLLITAPLWITSAGCLPPTQLPCCNIGSSEKNRAILLFFHHKGKISRNMSAAHLLWQMAKSHGMQIPGYWTTNIQESRHKSRHRSASNLDKGHKSAPSWPSVEGGGWVVMAPNPTVTRAITAQVGSRVGRMGL